MLGSDPNKELLKDSTRLAAFLQECLALGSLRGFRHFKTFVRGREELVLYVYSNKFMPEISTLMPEPILENRYSKNKASQWHLSEATSPMDTDLRQEKDRIIFLVAGYAKYRCPYVWLRSHHEQLMRTQAEKEDDNPLQLKKTTDWKTKNVSLWEIVTEILYMTTNPDNPFALDFNYIDQLPLEESVLLSGSLLTFLESIWMQADPDIGFADKVHEDIQKLQSKHLEKIFEYDLKTSK